MSTPFLSIIIPVYNCEIDIFKKCIYSVRSIQISYEIIIIDDGSSDKLSSEYENFAKRLSVIKYYKQKNAGVSSARNKGIYYSSGKYILFLDADDEISPDLINFINVNSNYMKADWILCGINMLYLKSGKRVTRPVIQESQTEIIQDVSIEKVISILVGSKELNECCGKFIKRDVIVNCGIRFPDGIIESEDIIFNIRLISNIHSIQFIPIKGYIYKYIPHSKERLIKNYKVRFKDREQVNNELELLIKHKVDSKLQSKYMNLWKIKMSINTVQSAMILWENKMLDKEAKQYIESWITKNKVNSFVPMRYFKSVKSFLYYIITKFKMWYMIPMLVKVSIFFERKSLCGRI